MPSWLGVECSDGKVVVLNLEDLCIQGRLAPDLGTLVHIKPIIMINNSFTEIIPKEIEELKQLHVLDLGYNNFNGSLPHELGINLSLIIILLDNNEFLNSFSPKIYGLKKILETEVDEYQLSNPNVAKLFSKQRFNTWWILMNVIVMKVFNLSCTGTSGGRPKLIHNTVEVSKQRAVYNIVLSSMMKI